MHQNLMAKVYVSFLSTFPKGFSSETTWPISFHTQLPRDGGKESLYIFRPGHMTQVADIPHMIKNLENLLQNQWADRLKTWYVASGELVLQSLYKR